MEEELDVVLKKIKSRKAAGFEEIPSKVWKTRKFDDILFQSCNTVYKQNNGQTAASSPFPRKVTLLGLEKKKKETE